ncbi:LamG domain-containing protein [Exilibacterium tricleocarpae]|uniref:LamG domain-containing protein n=2 Tax=Exilibacterium tricleocarpae TaxID=2591008 RepID=A0A545TZV8_9GAMM|nr:LamG domain-containing protein [Exilibacterium tricleocarpae]
MTSGFTGCSSGSSSDNPTNPNTSNPDGGGLVYSGPPPQTADVQSFKLNVWDNLAGDDRCGACHLEGGSGPTKFVHRGDINTAYAAANTLVDLGSPSNSEMVSKVAGGHNCWTSSPSVCADIITNYIEGWASIVGGDPNVIVLDPLPPEKIRDPGEAKFIPSTEQGNDFDDIYGLLTTYCAACHTENGGQQPFFASANRALAYEAAKSKIDINAPEKSRFVVRLRNESHNCWSNCGSDATEMENAIVAFADTVTANVIDTTNLVVSKAMNLEDGIAANTGGRYESNVIALYEFSEKLRTDVAFDTSGVDPAMDLTLSDEGVTKLPTFGLRFEGGRAQASTSASAKLHNLISSTGEYSIEAWVVPANVTQEESRIVSYSGGGEVRNFMLGQTLYNYDFFNRSTVTDANGGPALSTDPDEEVLQASLQHVVVTFDPINGRRLYVNGEYTEDLDESGPGLINEWDDSYAFVLGSEAGAQIGDDTTWQGSVRLLAIFNRVLTDEQIAGNFEAGVGEKFLLMFSVSHILEIEDAYVVVQAEQFDVGSYLFSEPFFQILDSTVDPNDIVLRGMRIGVNGAEAKVGQAFGKLDVRITNASYAELSRQPLSRLGAVIAKGIDVQTDEFFLTFDQLGLRQSNRPAEGPVVIADPVIVDTQSRLGLRTFEEIDATIAAFTGVSRANAAVKQTFENVKRQLPAVPNLNTFGSSHQMGVVQLAASYCGELVDNTSARGNYFPGFDFNAGVAAAFNGAGRSAVIDPLIERLLSNNLPDVPTSELPLGSGAGAPPASMSEVVTDEVNALIDRLLGCATCGTGAARTQTIVKAACAAAASNAVVMLQ